MKLPPAGRRGSFLLVAPLLVIAILLEQLCLVRFFPWLGGVGRYSANDYFSGYPASSSYDRLDTRRYYFCFLLSGGDRARTLPLSHFSRTVLRLLRTVLWSLPGTAASKQGWGVFTGWWVLLIFLTMAGGLYYLIEEQLPRQIRNGIDSFGIRADIALPYPLEGVLHLTGECLCLSPRCSADVFCCGRPATLTCTTHYERNASACRGRTSVASYRGRAGATSYRPGKSATTCRGRIRCISPCQSRLQA